MYDGLYTAAEQRYGLPPGILKALAQHESAENTWAHRPEPKFREKYIGQKPLDQLPGKRIPGASEETERADRSASWGLLQVMGETARELWFIGPFLTQLCDPETGIEFGAKHLKRKLDNAEGDLVVALQKYNGGGDPDYAEKVLARWKR